MAGSLAESGGEHLGHVLITFISRTELRQVTLPDEQGVPMLKPIFVLASALALTTPFAVAKADGGKTITILTIIEEGKPSVSIELADGNGAGYAIAGDNITYDDGNVGFKTKRMSVVIVPANKKYVAVKSSSQTASKVKAVRNGLTSTTVIRNNFDFVGQDAAGKPLSFKFKKGVAILTTTSIEVPKYAAKPKI